MPGNAPPNSPVAIAGRLSRAAARCRFGSPVAHVYNPLDYAFEAHRAYLERFCRPGVQALLLGMNPGPFGMVQTGVPFGEVASVRDWLGIATGVAPPERQHPKRPVQGFACRRSEISGQRLWGWARTRFSTPEAFFGRFFVWNYCPLAFLEASGRNRTPDKLRSRERDPLYEACDRALREITDFLAPRLVLGIGVFAESRARTALDRDLPVSRILHPSPASPAANRGWAAQVERQLAEAGVALDSVRR